MTVAIAGDTPIKRLSIAEMTSDQLDAHITSMRERRMRSHNLYQEAQEAKARVKDEKDRAQYEKRLEQMAKKLETAEKAMDVAIKYHNEIKVLRIVLGIL